MSFERFDDAQSAEEAARMMETLGPAMVVSGWDSMVAPAKEGDTNTIVPVVIVRFAGHEAGSIEVGTSTVVLSLGNATALIQTLVEQVGHAQNAAIAGDN